MSFLVYQHHLKNNVPVTLTDERVTLATLSLSTANVALSIRPKSLRISGRLGNLALVNENASYSILEDFNQLMSINGQNFANFNYQTFDPDEGNYTGVGSSIHLDAASIKFHFVEQPLHDILLFISKLAKLKGLYDAATQVAVQKASELEKMQFEVSIKTPIVAFPSNPCLSRDSLVLQLGQIGACNTCESVDRISASLHGIQLVSNLYRDGEISTLKIIDDIDVVADIVRTDRNNAKQESDLPDTQVCDRIYCRTCVTHRFLIGRN